MWRREEAVKLSSGNLNYHKRQQEGKSMWVGVHVAQGGGGRGIDG